MSTQINIDRWRGTIEYHEGREQCFTVWLRKHVWGFASSWTEAARILEEGKASVKTRDEFNYRAQARRVLTLA